MQILEKLFASFKAKIRKGTRVLQEFLTQEMTKTSPKATCERLCEHALEMLNIDISLFKQIINNPIPRVTYSEALDILKRKLSSVVWGMDISSSDECILTEYFNNSPIIITAFPQKLSSFYKQVSPENPECTLSVDVIAPNGYGELIGGSMRKYDVESLRKSLCASRACSHKTA